MLNGLPASAWISAVSREISVSISAGEALQLGAVDADAGPFHARQHARQRQLDFVVELAQAATVHRRRKLLEQLQRDIGVLLRRGPQLQIHAPPRLLFQRAARGVGIQQEGVQHDVVIEAARLDSQPRQFQQRRFHVAGDLHRGRVFEPRLQRREMLGVHGARLARPPGQADRIQRELAFGRFRNRHRHRRALRLRQPRAAIRPPLAITPYCRSRVSSLGPSSLSRLWNSISL